MATELYLQNHIFYTKPIGSEKQCDCPWEKKTASKSQCHLNQTAMCINVNRYFYTYIFLKHYNGQSVENLPLGTHVKKVNKLHNSL